MDDIQTIVDKNGDVTAVVVPVAAWREIAEAIETHHLLRSPAVQAQVLDALEPRGAAARLRERLGGTEA